MKKKRNCFEDALKKAKPMKGKMNAWQYENLKKLIPEFSTNQEYEKQVKRICEKIEF